MGETVRYRGAMAGNKQGNQSESERMVRPKKRRHDEISIEQLAQLTNLKLRYTEQFHRIFTTSIELYWDDEHGFDKETFSDDFVKSNLFFEELENLWGTEAKELLILLTRM